MLVLVKPVLCFYTSRWPWWNIRLGANAFLTASPCILYATNNKYLTDCFVPSTIWNRRVAINAWRSAPTSPYWDHAGCRFYGVLHTGICRNFLEVTAPTRMSLSTLPGDNSIKKPLAVFCDVTHHCNRLAYRVPCNIVWNWYFHGCIAYVRLCQCMPSLWLGPQQYKMTIIFILWMTSCQLLLEELRLWTWCHQ